MRLPDGTIPSAAQIKANSTLLGTAQTSSNATEAEAATAALEKFEAMDIEKMREIGLNVFKAHKKAEEDGLFDWSMAGYLRYALGYVPSSQNLYC